MPRGRPKGSKKFDPRGVAVEVWKALQSQGHELTLRYDGGKSALLRGQHSLKVAVAEVAKKLKCSPTTVWNAWSRFDPFKYEMQREKAMSDFEWDMAHTLRHDTALESLQREFGNREEFSEAEIEERAQEIEEGAPDTDAYRDFER
jgi:hypothetical protein